MNETHKELSALRRRVAALEERLARLGCVDDDVHPCVRTREVELHGLAEDGESVVRGRLHTYEIDGEAFAELQLLDASERVRVGVSSSGPLGSGVTISDAQGRQRAAFGVTGDIEDRAVLRLDDADGNPGVLFSTGTVSQATALAGWPSWVHDLLTAPASPDDADNSR